MISEIKLKIEEIIYYFKKLPKEKKITLVLIVSSVLIFMLGSIGLIMNSILSIEKETEKQKIRTLNMELTTKGEELKEKLETYDYESMQEEIKKVNEMFDSYKDDLDEIDTKLGDFKLPVSSPITNEE